MDEQLFLADGDWEVADTFLFQFFNVTSVCKIGQHAIGSEFRLAEMDYEKGILTLYAGDEIWRYPLSLTVGPLLSDKE